MCTPFDPEEALANTDPPSYTFSATIAQGETTEAEIATVKEWLSDADDKLAVMQAEAHDLGVRARQAYLGLYVARKLVEENKSITSVLRRVPAEILGYIMKRAVNSEPRYVQLKMALNMAQTCTVWRNVALSDKHLWNFLSMVPSQGWGWTTEEQGQRDAKRMERTQALIERSDRACVDVLIDCRDSPSSAAVLQRIVELVPKWRQVEIRNYDVKATTWGTDSVWALPLLRSLQGRVGELQALRLTGASANQWGVINDTVDTRQIAWFQDAPRLQRLSVSGVHVPETCRLRGGKFELRMSDGNQAATNSDLLGNFVFAGLKTLSVSGFRFGRRGTDTDTHVEVVDSILDFWRWSDRPELETLVVALSTGLVGNEPWRLLTEIPTLKSFTAEQSFSDEGILQIALFEALAIQPVTVDTLIIEGAQGPENLNDMNDEWIRKLVHMLTIQFSHGLRLVDFRTGRKGENRLKDITLRHLRQLKGQYSNVTMHLPGAVQDWTRSIPDAEEEWPAPEGWTEEASRVWWTRE
ncbi:hypothetical protein K438DRAFT_1770518 [Mycena galopus ATCC 62051]|nr:hypothetical protein K438DRAFT_1770518 [Mycena galopus ATCC 62051]